MTNTFPKFDITELKLTQDELLKAIAVKQVSLMLNKSIGSLKEAFAFNDKRNHNNDDEEQ